VQLVVVKVAVMPAYIGLGKSEKLTTCGTSELLVAVTVVDMLPPWSIVPDDWLSDKVKLKYRTVSVKVVVLTTPLEVIAVI